MPKRIQISGWSSLPSDSQKQVHEWITQILNARLAAQNLLDLLSQTSSVSDGSTLELVKALKNTTDNDFEVTDTALERDSDGLQTSRTNPDATSELKLSEARSDTTEDFCEMVTVLVCGSNNTDCRKEVRRICPGSS